VNRIMEVCVESVSGALTAQEGGADRVELCANLLEGGTTPSLGSIQEARRHLHVKMQVMIRPRGGDFCYSDTEFEIMKRDIAAAKQEGADGVVIGLLKPDGSIDEERTRELVQLARPLSVTFHRAFDMAHDPYEAMESLISIGIDRILTSGQESSVLEGLELIADLVRKAGDRIIIMPGGGITERNLARVATQSKAKELHVAALTEVQGLMQYRNPRCFMGGELRPPEFSLLVTDKDRICSFAKMVKSQY
jgi:copper homeostasis protein